MVLSELGVLHSKEKETEGEKEGGRGRGEKSFWIRQDLEDKGHLHQTDGDP